ncbi:hypothetical protein [Acidovorax kalamii]|uniref:hypothetical protein n=1 Tax=Acidovorax kalamii TaxID=2004485 RepID=UPI002090E356|nr:hypothetical protein [Acidovorax kalamii]MCO5358421.1 hypothetical protein [Acidovorax kalamii]
MLNAEELQQAARLEAARALPDSLFMEDAQVQTLRATYDARLLVSANQGSIKRWLMEERERLANQIAALEKSLAWAALADGAGKDATFALARAELAALESDKALVQTIDSALALLALPPGANSRIADEVDRTRRALNQHLFELKLSHIDGAKE